MTKRRKVTLDGMPGQWLPLDSWHQLRTGDYCTSTREFFRLKGAYAPKREGVWYRPYCNAAKRAAKILS